ncbi:MAG: hypothetical protein WB771_01120 [Solirubrobacterales bacterium]
MAGCGGSSDSSTTTAALSKSEFVAKADAICERGDKRIEAAAERYLGPGRPTRAQFVRFANAAVVPQTQQIVDGIRALDPPADVADTVDQMIADAQSVNDRLKADPEELASSEDPFADVNRLAKEAGLDACAGD